MFVFVSGRWDWFWWVLDLSFSNSFIFNVSNVHAWMDLVVILGSMVTSIYTPSPSMEFRSWGYQLDWVRLGIGIGIAGFH